MRPRRGSPSPGAPGRCRPLEFDTLPEPQDGLVGEADLTHARTLLGRAVRARGVDRPDVAFILAIEKRCKKLDIDYKAFRDGAATAPDDDE